MDIRVLKYFLAVCNEKNIVNAAKSLNLTQPTLSRQLIELEKEIGKSLFERGNKYITLTNEGMLLRKRAEEIISLAEKTKDELSSIDEYIQGTIYIGAAETYIMRYVAKTIKSIIDEYENIKFKIHSGDELTITEKIDSGIIDFGLLLHPSTLDKYDFIKLKYIDEFAILLNKKSKLSKIKRITYKDLINEPLILSEQFASDKTEVRKVFGSSHKINIVATYNLINNAKILVEENVGVCLCLDKLIDVSNDKNIIYKKIYPEHKIDAYIVWKKQQELTNVQKVFIESIKRICK